MKYRHFSTSAVAVALGLCFLAFASYCHAEDQPLIAAIEVNGLKTMSLAEFLGKIKIKKGDVFSGEAVAEDIARLADEGIIVEVKKRVEPDGVVVIFDVLAERVLPEVVEVRFEGGPAADLADIVRTRRGSKLVDYLLKADSARIADYFIERGYANVAVEPDVETVDPGKVKVTFVISRGPKFQLRKLTFVGNKELDRGDLEKVMATKVDTWLTSRKFVRKAFEEDIVRLNMLYQSKGYLSAVVKVGQLSIDSETGRVEAVIKITEGPRYKVMQVVFDGNKAVGDQELLGVIVLRQGAFYEVEALQNDVEALHRYYTTGGRGYASVSVRPEVKEGEQPATLVLTFIINEGRQTYIRRIETRGNYKTRKKVIVREMLIAPGDVFDTSLIRKSVRRLKDLQYFEKINTTLRPAPPPKAGAEEGADYMDLIVEVEETETGRILVGAGFNTNSELIAQISVEQRNFDIGNLPDFNRYGIGALSPSRSFIGGGQTLRLAAEPGSERSRYYFEFEEPWLFDYPVEFYLSGYVYERFFNGYTVGRLGGTVGLGKRFSRKFKVNLRYRRERVDIRDITASSPPDAVRQRGTHDLGIWRVSAGYDTRDNRIFPISGGTIGSYVEIAGGPAGGNVNFWKYGVDGSLYVKLWEFPKETPNVLALRAETGLSGPAFGDAEVPIYERYFAGGLRSLRGFAFRGIGPRQTVPPTGDTALGGEFMVLGTAEYRIPIVTEDYQTFLFLDVGTVSSSISANAFEQLRASAGLGFRFSLPVMGRVPMTFNFGFPLKKEPQDKLQVFTFALGLFF